MAAVQRNGLGLKHVAPNLQRNREIVLAAVRHNGLALQYADATLRDDLEIVIAAVQSNGLALAYASPRLQGTLSVVEHAVSRDAEAIRHAATTICENADHLLRLVRLNGRAYRYLSPAMQKDPAMALAALTQDPDAYADLQPSLQSDISLLAFAALTNHRILAQLHGSQQQAVWHQLQQAFQPNGLHFSPDMLGSYPAFLQGIGLANPARLMAFRDLYEAWCRTKNRCEPPRGNRPIALLLVRPDASKEEPRHNQVIAAFQQSPHFLTLYEETRDGADVRRTIERTVKQFGRPIHTMVITSQGDALPPDLLADIAPSLDPNGQLLLDTAFGGTAVAPQFALQVPPTFHIYSTRHDAAPMEVAITNDLRLRVTWTSGEQSSIAGTQRPVPKRTTPKQQGEIEWVVP
ncbi:MAG: DUF4116 domain-containing protein [Deltaproteobacteria bacterium]|nr:DUF4116 domain-containing protein [Deltaproteobacteria bacterium]